MFEQFAWGATGWGDELARGLALTLQLAFTSLFFGLILGLIGAAGKLSPYGWVRRIADGYANVIRGVPELLIILFVFFGSGRLIRWVASQFGYTQYIEISAFVAGVIALSLIFGGYASETFRGAFQSVHPGQIEAARAIGMNRWQILYRIQMPQVWRYALPGLGNLWLVLIKDTSLVSVIALAELMRMTFVAVGSTRQPFSFFLAASFLYLCITLASILALRYMNAWAARGVRRA